MLQVLKQNGKVIERCDQFEEGCWINMVAPTPEELKEVQSRLPVLTEFLHYPLDEEETSRIEKEEDQVLIIIKIPDARHEGDVVRYETIPLGIILIDSVIITICLKKTQLIDELLSGRAVITGLLCDPIRFIFHIFLRTAALFLKHLRLIDRLTSEYENELHRSLRNQELIKLLNLEKSLVYFNTSLRANELVMARLQSGRYVPITEGSDEVLEDALIENQQAIEMAKIYSDILSGMMDAYASVISNNINVVMKFLTSVTIILSLPTLVASVYGMNIPLPLQNHPHAFGIVIGFSLALSALVVFFLFRKKML